MFLCESEGSDLNLHEFNENAYKQILVFRLEE